MSDSATPWTIVHQASLSIEFSRQEYWSGLPFPSSGDLPNPGIKYRSPELQADSLPSEPIGKPMTNLDSILKNRDITLPTKVHVVKAMVFPVTYGCESLTINKGKGKGKLLSPVQLFATPWTVAYQAPLSMGVLQAEYRGGLPTPLPGDLSNPGIEPRSPSLWADSLPAEPPG